LRWRGLRTTKEWIFYFHLVHVKLRRLEGLHHTLLLVTKIWNNIIRCRKRRDFLNNFLVNYGCYPWLHLCLGQQARIQSRLHWLQTLLFLNNFIWHSLYLNNFVFILPRCLILFKCKWVCFNQRDTLWRLLFWFQILSLILLRLFSLTLKFQTKILFRRKLLCWLLLLVLLCYVINKITCCTRWSLSVVHVTTVHLVIYLC
jgi:hypothetical protein